MRGLCGHYKVEGEERTRELQSLQKGARGGKKRVRSVRRGVLLVRYVKQALNVEEEENRKGKKDE